MTAGLAWWLVLWVALSVGIYCAHRASAWTWPYRIAPGAMVCLSGWALSDRTLTVFGVAMTAAQNPLKPYLPALVVLACSATALTVLMHRRMERCACEESP